MASKIESAGELREEQAVLSIKFTEPKTEVDILINKQHTIAKYCKSTGVFRVCDLQESLFEIRLDPDDINLTENYPEFQELRVLGNLPAPSYYLFANKKLPLIAVYAWEGLDCTYIIAPKQESVAIM